MGTIETHFNVTPDGAATLSIPIAVPPGREGIEPSLSFDYDSRRGNGPLGVGWTLDGLSEVRRCRKTFAQDGYAAGVSFDQNDALCLDGNRLVEASTHSCPGNGREYRTETHPFSRICRYEDKSAALLGEWRVWEKDGSIRSFGRVEWRSIVAGATLKRYSSVSEPILAWALAKVEDRRGNFFLVLYRSASVSTNPATYLPSQILYTGGERLRPSRRLDFIYETRPDPIRGFYHGVAIDSDLRLARIATYGPGGHLTTTYRLSYDATGTTGRSKLASLQKCGSDDVCIPATTFGWSQSSGLSFQRSYGNGQFESAPVGGYLQSQRIVIADFDGSGRKSLLVPRPTATPGLKFDIYHSDDTGSFTKIPTGVATSAAILATPLAVDTTGDGRPELISIDRCPQCVMNVYYGPTFSTRWQTPMGAVVIRDKWVGDFDGDGMQELLLQTYVAGRSNPFAFEHMGVIPGDLVDTGISPGSGETRPFSFVGDFDGDGADDLLYYDLPVSPNQQPYKLLSYKPFLNPQDPSQVDYKWVSRVVNVPNGLLPPFAAALDCNGDGLLDLVVGQSGVLHFWINTGSEFVESGTEIPIFQSSDPMSITLAPDLDGDGVDEVLFSSASNGNLVVADVRGGATRTRTISTDESLFAYGAMFVDVNADGNIDVITTNGRVFHRVSAAPELLISIRSGLNPDTPNFPNPDVAIQYAVAGHGSIYIPHSINDFCPGYDSSCIPHQFPLVSSTRVLIGSTSLPVVSNYRYGDGRFHRGGRGWLGFSDFGVENTGTGQIWEYHFDNDYFDQSIHDFPHSRLPAIVTTKTQLTPTKKRIHSLESSYVLHKVNNGKSYFVVPNVQVDSVRERDHGDQTLGKLLSKTTTQLTYDDFGNMTSSSIRSQSSIDMGVSGSVTGAWVNALLHNEFVGHGLVVSKIYDVVESEWLVSRLKQQTVQATSSVCETIRTTGVYPDWLSRGSPCPAGGDVSSNVLYEYNPATGKHDLIERIIYEPASALRRQGQFEYDRYGNVTAVTWSGIANLQGRTERRRTEFQYDSAERIFPVLKIDAERHATRFIFDRDFGLLTGLQQPNNVISTIILDGLGRASADVTSGQASMARTWISGPTYGRPDLSAVLRLASSAGPKAEFDFDRLGQLVASRRFRSFKPVVVRTRTYDALGRLSTESVPYFEGTTPAHTVAYTYDALGRPLSASSINGNFGYTYDALDRTTTDPLGNKFHDLVLPDGTTLARVDQQGGVTRYYHDGLGRLSVIADPSGHATGGNRDSALTYSTTTDGYGRITAITGPDVRSTTFSYNAFDDVMQIVDAVSSVAFEYDRLGRLRKRIDGDGVTSWTWDSAPGAAIGKLASTSSPNGTQEALTYDQSGRVASYSIVYNNPVAQLETDFGYDTQGRISSVTYPTVGPVVRRASVSHTYAPYGELAKVSRADVGHVGELVWSATDFDAWGHTTHETFGNGATTDKTFDAKSGRLTLSTTNSTNGLVDSVSLSRDALGNVITLTRSGSAPFVADYAHDELGRLTSMTYPDTAATPVTITYSGAGSISSKSDVGSYGYDDPVHANAITRAGISDFTYDAGGKQISRLSLGIRYNAFSAPSQILDPQGSPLVTFGYSASQERVSRKTPAESLLNVHEVFQARVSGSSTQTRAFIAARDGLVAEIVDDDSGSNSRAYYLHGDALGSVTSITDWNGAIAGTRQYDAFGKLVSPISNYAPDVNIGFTGHRDELDLSLIEMGPRLYDPKIAAFLSPDESNLDTTDSQTLNGYSYARNSPTILVDPTGLRTCECGGGCGHGTSGGGHDYSGGGQGYSGGGSSGVVSSYRSGRGGTARSIGGVSAHDDDRGGHGDARYSIPHYSESEHSPSSPKGFAGAGPAARRHTSEQWAAAAGSNSKPKDAAPSPRSQHTDETGIECPFYICFPVNDDPLEWVPAPFALIHGLPSPDDPWGALLPHWIPPGVDVRDNIAEARGRYNPWWFFEQVRNKGPWDYKQSGKELQDFGNFNFGATGGAFGFPLNALHRGAGWAQQQAGTSLPEWGSPFGEWPYGDDPRDSYWITEGYYYFLLQSN
ncbi:MAG TPA: FG-GAP-like repeat-containing protein [Terriglobales bacterium]|nr:FG-GAP-like repeat-containing protein [Terriglobales bacterium]